MTKPKEGKKKSTSALAKLLRLKTKELFTVFQNKKYIERVNDSWELTDLGKSKGGEYKESKQYGRYIVWPTTLSLRPSGDDSTSIPVSAYLTATAIGKQIGMPATRTNALLSELGWIERYVKGWRITDSGRRLGGKQEEASNGVPYVTWPDSILDNPSLKDTLSDLRGDEKKETADISGVQDAEELQFREKFPAKHRSTDGHLVRSRAEMLIDNWLYMAEIVHAYERKLPIEEDVYCDFYIPAGKVYIEFWGYQDKKYLARKQKKREIYQNYGFNLIELDDTSIQILDDILPGRLLKFGVQSY